MQTPSQTIYCDQYVVNTVALGPVEPTFKWPQKLSGSHCLILARLIGKNSWGRYGRGVPQARLVLFMFTE